MRFRIKFNQVEQVKEFVSMTEKQKFEVDIETGRQVVDAKSILGVFSIDMSRECWVVIHADEIDCKEYLKSIHKYLL